MTENRPRIVTQPPPRPSRRWQWLAAGLVVGAAILAAMGWWQAGPDTTRYGEQLAQAQAIAEQRARELALLSRSQKVTEAANADLRKRLIEVENEQAQLREEIAFYRRLLDVGGSFRGLAVHDFVVTPTSSPQVFDYSLVLSQNLNKATVIDGTFDISVQGVLQDRAETLTAQQVGLTPAELVFSFKYYQNLRGSLSLPRDFQPRTVTVSARRKGRDKAVTQTYDWP